MLNIFRRKSKKEMNGWELQLLKAVVGNLPAKYSFLIDQINEEFILDAVQNELLKSNWKRTILNQNMNQRYVRNKFNYKLSGISAYDLRSETFLKVELDVYEGILIGYRVIDGLYDLSRVQVEGVTEIPYGDSTHDSRYAAHLKGKTSSALDFRDGFEIEFSGRAYFVIKDLNDGNYLAIDSSGIVYGMFHDPFLIEIIHSDFRKFVDEVNAGRFSIEEYHKSKFE